MKIIVSVFFLAALVTITSLLMSSSFHNECKDIYEEHGTTGSFVLYDHKNDSYDYCNEIRCEKRFCPASTFKIPNSIIGLETGAIDPDEKFKWDGKQRAIPSWNQDHGQQVHYHRMLIERLFLFLVLYLLLFLILNYLKKLVREELDT